MFEHQDWNQVVFHEKSKNDNKPKNVSQKRDKNKMKKIPSSVSKKIIAARMAKKYNCKQLAAIINAKPIDISVLESGNCIYTLDNEMLLNKICRVLGIKIDRSEIHSSVKIMD